MGIVMANEHGQGRSSKSAAWHWMDFEFLRNYGAASVQSETQISTGNQHNRSSKDKVRCFISQHSPEHGQVVGSIDTT